MIRRLADGLRGFLLIAIDDWCPRVHLGLAGSMIRCNAARDPSSGIRLRLVFGNPPQAWDLAARLKCELLIADEVVDLLDRLGPDLLRGDDPAAAFQRINRSTRPIGDSLFDQNVIAGVGTVFRAESLHRVHLHPRRPGADLSDAALQCPWTTLTHFTRRGSDEGRIITVENEIDRGAIAEADGRFVYKHCCTCGSPVRIRSLCGPTAYACERCQPVVA